MGTLGGRSEGVGTGPETNRFGPERVPAPAVDEANHEAEADAPSDVEEPGEELPAAVVGRSGGRSRDLYVTEQNEALRRAAASGPMITYDGDVFRSVPTRRYRTYNDYTFSAPGRYNAPGVSMLYNSLDFRSVEIEADKYAGLADNTVVRSRFTGEVLDTRELPGVTAGALEDPYGSGGSHRTLLSRITGEDPYFHARSVGEAAVERGSGGIIVPADGGATHLNVMPDNIARFDEAYRYLDHQSVDADGRVGPVQVDPTVAQPPLGAPNRNAGDANVAFRDAEVHARAGNLRYGIAGAGIAGTYNALADGRLDASDTVHVATDMGTGGITAYADDVLSQRSGAPLRAGAIVDGVVTVASSTWSNADAVDSGEMSAGDATADVAVDTGVAVTSGLAGAAAGAAIGSVVPVAGTAIGAAIGFGIGLGASIGTSALLEGTGLTGWARAGLGDVLEDHFEAPLQAAWEVASDARSGLETAWSGASDVASGVGGTVADAADAVGDGLGRVGDTVQGFAGDVLSGAAAAVGGLFGR